MRSRLREDRTSWSVTSTAFTIMKPRRMNRSGGKTVRSRSASMTPVWSCCSTGSGSGSGEPTRSTSTKRQSNCSRKCWSNPVADSVVVKITGTSLPAWIPYSRSRMSWYASMRRAPATVCAHERAAERGRRVERAQLEGIQGRSVLLLPESQRKQRAHDQVDECAMVLNQRFVMDHGRQLGCRASPLTNQPRDRSAAELMIGGQLGPEGDQGGEAELTSERKGLRIRLRCYWNSRRFGPRAPNRRHGRILPASSSGSTGLHIV